MVTQQGRQVTGPWQVCSSRPQYCPSSEMHSSSAPRPAGSSACWVLVESERKQVRPREGGTCPRSHRGSQTCDGHLAACLQPLLCSMPTARLLGEASLAGVVAQGARLPRGLVLLWLHPIHPPSSCVPRCATDHNVDNTTEMLQEWLATVGNDYAAVVWRPEGESRW